ncbi:MAG: yngC1 [Parcubacteria group bacterium]|nr:yngC1 [Parcubacteria group bacterium]
MLEFFQRMIMEPGIWGAIGLFAVAAIDEVAPVPASLILVGELLFLKNPLSVAVLGKLIFFVAFPIALGTMLGSLVVYTAAYAGGKPSLDQLKKKFSVSTKQIDRFESLFKNRWYDNVIFFFFRATPLVPTLPVSIIGGIVRMPPLSYGLLTLLGIIVRVMITLVILKMGGDAVLSHAFNL